ncbi:MAG: phosphotransferase [Alphaproteobacteria bacterium]
MTVYTHIDKAGLRDFLKDYDLGTLVSFSGIEKGVSNTNYHVETTSGPYILTIFEPQRVSAEELPSALEEMINSELDFMKPHDPMGYLHRLKFHRDHDVTQE